MIQRGKLKFDQCFNGTNKGVFFKISKILDVPYFEDDFYQLENSIEMMLTLGYITTKKYQTIKDDK